MRDGRQIVEFVEERIGQVFQRPLMLGRTSEAVDLILHYCYELWAEAREWACEDLWVHEIGGPTAYREPLSSVAFGLVEISVHPLEPSIGLAMAPELKPAGRLARLQNGPGIVRCMARWLLRALAVMLVAMVASGLGVARLTRAEVDEPKSKQASGEPRVFKLTVVSAESGKPVPKADVRVWIALSSYWAQTDEQGRLDIPHRTSRADTHVSADIWGDGFAAQRWHWGRSAKEPVPDAATVKLYPGETLGGMVRDEQGGPIAGAEVFLWSHNYKKADPHEILYDLRAVTGPDGTWKTSGAPKTTGELLGVRLIHPDYLSAIDYTTKDFMPTIADLREGRAVTVMKRGIPIEGEVLDAAGEPVENATVRVIEGQMRHESESFGLTKTDAKGRFRSRQLKAGTWHVFVMARGSAPAVKVLTINEQAPPYQVIQLEKPKGFRGRVLDSKGRPVVGAFVNVDTWNRYRCLNVFLYSDKEGRVQWDDAPADPLTFGVSHEGYIGLHDLVVAPTEKETVFTLRPALQISGRVRDAITKKAVGEGKVEFGGVDPKSGHVTDWTPVPKLGPIALYQGYLNVSIATDDETAFYKFRILANGYEPFLSRAFPRDEGTVLDYDITLQPAGD
jgi:uncharacterized GH25 family protein